MSVKLDSLAEIARDTGSLLSRVNGLREGGDEEKTAAIEQQALQLIDALEKIVEESGTAGEAPAEELKNTLEAQEAALRVQLESSKLSLDERMKVLGQLADLNFRLANLIVGRTLTWDRLISAQELAQYRLDLQEAAKEVRRQKKLQNVSRSILSILSISLGITGKMAAL